MMTGGSAASAVMHVMVIATRAHLSQFVAQLRMIGPMSDLPSLFTQSTKFCAIPMMLFTELGNRVENILNSDTGDFGEVSVLLTVCLTKLLPPKCKSPSLRSIRWTTFAPVFQLHGNAFARLILSPKNHRKAAPRSDASGKSSFAPVRMKREFSGETARCDSATTQITSSGDVRHKV